MPEIYKRLFQELSSGRPAIMATIIRQSGSSPRSLGTRFVVCQDGSLVGSIGGGKLEARVIEAAKDLLGHNVATVMEISMTGKEAAGTDMICGGEVEVLIQGITPANAQACEILESVFRLTEKGGQGILAMGPLPALGKQTELNMILYQPEAEVIGSIRDDNMVLELIRSNAKRIMAGNITDVISFGNDGSEVIMEPLFSQPTAIVFGGGHISVNLVPLLDNVDFRVVVVDDRADFANQHRFPKAARIIVSDYEDCFVHLEFTPETYCVIVTRGHLYDKTVLENVLVRPTRYIGMIGSRRKRDMVYKALMKQGFSPESLGKVNSPIGLGIGAETPEEIALSIAAELVRVRAESR